MRDKSEVEVEVNAGGRELRGDGEAHPRSLGHRAREVRQDMALRGEQVVPQLRVAAVNQRPQPRSDPTRSSSASAVRRRAGGSVAAAPACQSAKLRLRTMHTE